MTEADVEQRRAMAERLLLTIVDRNLSLGSTMNLNQVSQILVDLVWMLADKHYDRYNDKLGYCTGEDS
jgi:hypothetical protein